MAQAEIEQGFTQLLEASETLQQALGTSFLDSYIETVENILDQQKVRVINGEPNAEIVKKLEAIYHDFQALPLQPEELRKVTQLVLLKGMMNDHVQPNHQLTPDALGFLFVYLIEALQPANEKNLTLLDSAVGAGNLLLTVILNLQLAHYQTQGFGVDIDETLLALAAVDSQLTDVNLELFHQDGLQPLLIDPVDFAISDLPVGYYPHDAKAKEFCVYNESEHTYAHHLLMEQMMKYVKDNGYGIFLVPENLLESNQTESLKKWLEEKVYIQALLKLPTSLFQSKHSRKSILIVQNKGEQSHQAKEVLLASIPSLKDPEAIQGFFAEFTQWKKQNLEITG